MTSTFKATISPSLLQIIQKHPIGKGITVETLDYDEAIRITREKLEAESRSVVAEAALLVHPFFIRVDILIRDEQSKSIEIIEVKSKSVSDETVGAEFRNSSGKYEFCVFPCREVRSNWRRAGLVSRF